MPGRLHLDKEFTAEENIHANILKKPLTDSKGATSNDLTVQASNLLSEKGDKEEKQTTRMGPLTFDVNPELKKDEHNARNIYLVLSLHTGCVSPQYHCQFDDFFEMVRPGRPDVSVPSA
jgi:hypothetical protein